MTATGNIATLITIVFGLMLTDLFASVHRLIRNRRRVRWHWLPLLVAWYMLTTVLKNWWALVSHDGGGVWASGWMFFFYGHLLLLLYLAASAVLPDEIPADGLDLRKFYVGNRRHFWGLLAGVALAMLLVTLLLPVFTESPLNWPAVWSNIVFGATALSLAWVRRIGYHAVVVVVSVALVTTEMIVKF
ncbi:MAG: hypothetical protein JXB04_08395 [Kiritimatiellae bacterium]|nr:hypothetical protein [Kiritimatiellia bacterium]